MLLGLAFKPGTDDVRESVSLKIINYLLKNKTKILAHDPIAIDNSKKVVGKNKNLEFINDWKDNLSSVDAILVATKWEEYKKLSSAKYQDELNGKDLFDIRRFFTPKDFPKSVYLTIGRSI